MEGERMYTSMKKDKMLGGSSSFETYLTVRPDYTLKE